MNNKNINDTQLNALIDGELLEKEKVEVLNGIENSSGLAKVVSETRQDMDLISLAYGNLHMEKNFDECIAYKTRSEWLSKALAASMLLVIGIMAGWGASNYQNTSLNQSFSLIEDYYPTQSNADKVMIHVNSMNIDKVYRALSKLEETLKVSNKNHSNIQVKFIANSEGVAVLRQGSPYAEKIKVLSERYGNVKFLACGVAIKKAKKKEHKEIVLLPEVQRIPVAANDILASIEKGWLYTRP